MTAEELAEMTHAERIQWLVENYGFRDRAEERQRRLQGKRGTRDALAERLGVTHGTRITNWKKGVGPGRAYAEKIEGLTGVPWTLWVGRQPPTPQLEELRGQLADALQRLEAVEAELAARRGQSR